VPDGVVIYGLGPDLTDNQGNLHPFGLTPDGTDVGFRLWEVGKRRQPPVASRP
jgi:hypothetical protein